MSRERLPFYLKYALPSLRREGQRSFFAAFCVAVGVGAVVAMQSLGLVVTDTMTENVKAIVVGRRIKCQALCEQRDSRTTSQWTSPLFWMEKCYLLPPGAI